MSMTFQPIYPTVTDESAITTLASMIVTTEPWMSQAACAGDENPDDWFPDADDTWAVRRAKAVCETCPVRQQCLEYAMRTDRLQGIWGGTTGYERGALRRRVRTVRSTS